MPSRGAGLPLAPSQSPHSGGHPVSRSGAWLEEGKGSKGEEREGGRASWLLYCACRQAKECLETLSNGFILSSSVCFILGP